MHERCHNGIRNYRCNYCSQLFYKKYHKERHEKRKHAQLATVYITPHEGYDDFHGSMREAVMSLPQKNAIPT